jgi:4,5-DOPA dioxygenase extradiol
MPAIFIGHGSPMNAIQQNAFTQSLGNISKQFPAPKSILVISAHWMTKGSWVTHMAHPRTIHDFYGFPKELFDVSYPSRGNSALAEQIRSKIQMPEIHLDDKNWGLDHGTWSVIRHIYPKANIPIVQLSIDLAMPFEHHFEIGKKLRFLRDEGVWIVGSGNIVHHLGQIKWESGAVPYDWAVEFDGWVKEKLLQRNFGSLIQEVFNMESGRMSVPTTDHYIPLLYVLGASEEKDSLRFVYEKIEHGSISMRTMIFEEEKI